MSRSPVLFAVLSISVLALACGDGRAGEAEAREGWTRVETAPAWARRVEPPHGHFHVVSIGRSNLLHLAYPDPESPTARRNVRLEVLRRLAPVLGTEARAPAEAAAAAAKPIERVYHFQPAGPGRGKVVGGVLYTAFVLWEVPFAPVLAAAGSEEAEAVVRALASPGAGAATPWKAVAAEPPWAFDPPAAPGRFRAPTKHAGANWDLEAVVATLNAPAFLGSEVQGRLVPVLGNDLAFEVGMMARGHGRLLERVRIESKPVGWQLWDVGVDDVLAYVPERHRDAARVALAGPRPPRPSSWMEEVTETVGPAWVSNPPAWPGHAPVVQVRRSDLPELAKERSARMGEKDVAKALAAKLEPVLGADAAREAAARGARKRQLVRKALHDRPPAAGREEVPGARTVTVWTLWQVPLDVVLEDVPGERHDAVRAALGAH